jgi:hypothetical protein
MLWAHKMWGISLLDEELLASQEGLYSMALSSYFFMGIGEKKDLVES